MQRNRFDQYVFTEDDLISLYLKHPENIYKNKIIVTDDINFDPILELENIPKLVKQNELNISLKEFDEINHNNWFMPDSYKDLDIAKFVLDQCKDDSELQRAGMELLMYQERDMFMLLKYLKYLVDTMREYNILWGVGRGSSISSFVLYLIGIHRINSLYYDLDITEFLKPIT